MGDDGVRGDDVREPGRWRLLAGGASPWGRAAVLVVVLVPLVLALPYALFGRTSATGVTPIVVVLVMAVVSGRRGTVGEEPLRGLDPARRRRAVRTVLTGVPDGDPQVDQVAATMLAVPSAESPRTRRVALTVLLVLAAVVFVVAAVRHHPGWLAVGVVDVGGIAALLLPSLAYDRDAAKARFASDRDDPAHLDEA